MKTGEYTPTIGLEIHAELKTLTKMFCDSRNAPEGAAPNTYICPICMGHPGTLPVINKKAVESVVMVGSALDGNIATYTEFDRKNYFYPDIPKGYQISQYAYPLVSGGNLNGVAITRVHLEEDTARSLHDQGEGSIIDYNRAGVPLMELVTEPVIHDAKTASAFARELQLLLRSLGVSDAHMEKGQMRVEANISVGKGTTLGTKVEVKNLNSFKAVEGAIEHEVSRQIELLESGGQVVQETRGWDEARGKTFSQRKKESSHDYRYFPDPDIPKLKLDVAGDLHISRLNEISDKLPANKRLKLENLGIARNQIEILVSDADAENFFITATAGAQGVARVALTANYITSDIIGLLSARALSFDVLDADAPVRFAALVAMIDSKMITSRVAKDLLPEVLFERMDPVSLVTERGLAAVDSSGALLGAIDEVIRTNGKVADEYRAGKEASLQFLIGQVMRATRGSADPAMLKELLINRLKV